VISIEFASAARCIELILAVRSDVLPRRSSQLRESTPTSTCESQNQSLARRLLYRSEKEEACMSVGRICIREVDTVGPKESALDAARRMRERQVGTLVVVDGRARPMGLITDRDIAMRVVAGGCEGARTPGTS
jgi:signal-transduction protein with cAMP-binding, CBS, and nucleotidyltransferase domain